MTKGLGSLTCEEKLREFGLFNLQKVRLRVGLIPMCRCLKGDYKENEYSVFAMSHIAQMRGNGFKFQLGRFQLHTRGQFFIMRTISHGNNLTREMED